MAENLKALVHRARRLQASRERAAQGLAQGPVQAQAQSQVILLDVSSSMGCMAGAKTRIAILQEALDYALPETPGARLIAFSSTPCEIPNVESLPEPNGGTALHRALHLAVTMAPTRTLVITDGEPDSEERALKAAKAVPGTIDVIYCGSDEDQHAKDFLARLARSGGGQFSGIDLCRTPNALASGIRGLLAPPKKG